MAHSNSFQLHFSIDDVLPSLLEASDSGRPSDHWFFGFLDEIHRLIGIEVNLYLFEAVASGINRRTLADVGEAVSAWIRKRPWLLLGPHALDDATPPYAQTLPQQLATMERIYREIDRIAGPDQYSRWVRLHHFSETYELASLFREHGVQALLTTDKAAVCYRLPEEARLTLAGRGSVEYQGLRFIRSDIRIEAVAAQFLGGLSWKDALRLAPALRPPVVFTHEYALSNPEIREATRTVLGFLSATGRGTGTPQGSLGIGSGMEEKLR